MKVRVGLVLAVLACLLGQARAEAEGGAERAGTLVYRPEFYNGNAEEESDRLKAQVDMSFEPEFAQFGPRLVLARTLLEVSCGPGHFSERLLGALPRVSIVCVEIDARFIRESRRRLARFGRRFRAIRGDVRKLRGAVGQMGPFDAAVLRLILQHLPGEQVCGFQLFVCCSHLSSGERAAAGHVAAAARDGGGGGAGRRLALLGPPASRHSGGRCAAGSDERVSQQARGEARPLHWPPTARTARAG
jgi:SAM-dependent methyltransferase